MRDEPNLSMSIWVGPDTTLRTAVQASPVQGEEVLAALRFGPSSRAYISVSSVAAIDHLIDSLRELRRKSLEFVDHQSMAGQPTLLDDLEARAAS
jgi:hypothetical protein